MMPSELADVFNDCIERLGAGQSLDDCLRVYPDRAGELRPLLETALAVRRANPGVSPAARERVRARVMQAAGQIERQHRPSRWLPRPGLALAASLAVIVLVGALMLWLSRDSDGQGLHIQPLTDTSLPVTTVPTHTAAASPTVNTATAAPSETTAPAGAPTDTAAPTATFTAAPPLSATPSSSPTPSPTAAPACRFTITVSSANLREGPGTGYGVVGFGYRAEVFTVVARHTSGLWFQVETADERKVWVAVSVGELSGGCGDLPVSALPLRDGGTGTTSPTPGSGPTATPALPGPTPGDDSGSGSHDDSGDDSHDDSGSDSHSGSGDDHSEESED